MAQVKVRDGETLDHALRRFKRELRKENTMEEMRRRMAYQKPSDCRRQADNWAKRKAKNNPPDQERGHRETVLRMGAV